MIRTTIARASGFAVGAAMVLSFASQAHAVTIAELQAQIAALMAQLQSIQGGSTVATAAISSDLTVGSTGADVTTLQNALIAQGYLHVAATGYFGSLTKAAVMSWQAAHGVPSTGFFGPLSRASFNAGTTTGGTTTGGTTTGGTTTGGATGITTPGVEGDMIVTAAPVSNTTVYEGDSMVPVLAFKAQAKLSDIALQRVKLDLGSDSSFYRDMASKIYLVDDAGRVLASSDLNNNTVVKNSASPAHYEITLAGFSTVVSKDSTRTYTIKADFEDSIDSTTRAEGFTISLSNDGVRAIDGAGIDLYDPASGSDVTKTFTVSGDLADSASLTVSTDAATPLTQEVVASGGTNDNEADKVVLLVFDIRAEKDAVEITDINNFVVTSTGGTAATASTTYLYAGNGTGGQLLGTDSVSGTDSDFNDFSYTIPANSTKTFTLAADIRSANSSQASFSASLTGSTNIVGENTAGDDITSISGSATGNSIKVRNVGPVFTLAGTPTITRTVNSISTNSTSTATATFQLHIKAVGAPVMFGTLASSTPMASNGTNAPAKSFVIYQSGSAFGTTVYASSTDYSTPSSGVVASTESFTLQEGNEITIPVSFSFDAKDLAAGHDIARAGYAIGLERINWVSDNGLSASTFMAGKTEWRTGSVTLP